MTAALLSLLLALPPSQVEARELAEAQQAAEQASRVSPFEPSDAAPFEDMETEAERTYREWCAWLMLGEFSERMEIKP